MKVFISWSGRRSRKVAEQLRQWLPSVIQAVRPYFTPDDIMKGSRWSNEIARELEEAQIGIICLTRDNLNAPWVNFEAGALSKKLDTSKVCPFLLDIQPTDIEGPLVQFQATRFEKDEVMKLIRLINKELGNQALEKTTLDNAFEMWWPDLEKRIAEAMGSVADQQKVVVRTDRDLLEEILQLVRASDRPIGGWTFAPSVVGDIFEELVKEFLAVSTSLSEDSASEATRSSALRMLRPLHFLTRRLPLDKKKYRQIGQNLHKAQSTLSRQASLFDVSDINADDEEDTEDHDS